VEIKNKNFSHKTFSDWGVIKHDVPQVSTLGPKHFLLYVNDLSKTINRRSKPILFAVDTSILFTNSILKDFKNHAQIEFESLNKWFKATRLSLISDKIHFMQFTTKNSPQIDLDIGYTNKLISKAYDTKLFLGIYIYIYIYIYIHTYTVHCLGKILLNKLHKLSAACYAVRSVKPFMPQVTPKMVLLCLFSFHYEL